MMRQVVGAVMSCFAGLLLLWFILPLLNTSYELVKQTVDTTNQVNNTLLSIGDGIYLILGPMIFIIVGYLIFSYATSNYPFDT